MRPAARAPATRIASHEFFDPATRARAMARLKLESDLRLAVSRQELRVHYQPIVSMRTGDVVGFEALLRWQHPEQGLLAPAAFIAAAEETGLIVPISERVLLEAAGQVRAWQQRLAGRWRLSLSMNFTSTHFADVSIVDVVSDILRRTGLDGGSLAVEITERVLLQDVEAVTAVLRELRRRQIHVHLDDFGTGYSSLSYLQRLPVDALKVDRSFVTGLEPGGDAAVMLRAILDLVNDAWGHAAGDSALVQVKGVLRRVCRQSDTLIRWGGDEFLIIARSTDRPSATRMAERLRVAVRAHSFVFADNQRSRLSCSLGFAYCPFVQAAPKLVSWEQVVGLADRALYVAKQRGRDTWVGVFAGRFAPPEVLLERLDEDLVRLADEGLVELHTPSTEAAAGAGLSASREPARIIRLAAERASGG